MKSWKVAEPIVNISTIYVNQTIMLYALNLYNDVCQLFFNITGERERDRTEGTLSSISL